MSPDKENDPQNQFSLQSPVTYSIPMEREVVSYSVSDYELDSLSTFTTLTTLFTSLALLFLSVALAGFLERLDKSWLFVITMAVVGILFCGLGWFTFRQKSSHIERIRKESRRRSPY